MTPQRYKHLEKYGDPLLTDEVREGWHYCGDWDGMLIHISWTEYEACTCGHKEAWKTFHKKLLQ
jgi:hypothetical protein